MIDINELVKLRERLEKIFRSDTSHPKCRNNPIPSAGHCALVSVLFQDAYPEALIVSTYLKHLENDSEPSSHWLNYLDGWFIDLTADQFGYPTVRIFRDDLSNYRIRKIQHLDEEAIARLKLFLHRLEHEPI